MGKKYKFTVDRSANTLSFLAANVAGLSRSRAQRLLKDGEVRLNGARLRQNAELAPSDIVTVFVPDAFASPASAQTVYSDENIVIFDKPKHTPFDALIETYPEKLYSVHRLDTNTTGLICFAKSQDVRSDLLLAFKNRNVQKTYNAVVCPAPIDEQKTLTAYTLMRDNLTAAVYDQPREGAKTMITEYKVLQRYGNAALVEVLPHTGRTHQIRAHFHHIGCPIVGDPKYGGEKIIGAPDTQMLAAVRLCFSGLKGLSYLNGKQFETDNKFDLSFLNKQ